MSFIFIPFAFKENFNCAADIEYLKLSPNPTRKNKKNTKSRIQFYKYWQTLVVSVEIIKKTLLHFCHTNSKMYA